MAELTGVTVGNYFLLECLGREGMVESYRARPTTRGGFDVALRIFRPSFPDSTAFQEHFTTEVEKVWRCHHEHIQPLLEFGSGEDLLYTVTELPEERTLEHVLEHGENEEFFKPIPHIVRFITQVCDALHYAHKQHIVHGNIQPSRFLIQPDQDVFLTNFSMKRIYQEGDPLVAQIEEGNAAYIAPEQVVGILTPASDIYAVGILLYQLLTGHLPYDGESAGEIALKHANEAIPSLRQLRPDLSEAVELVVRVALAKSPEARFPSADALARALLAAIASDLELDAFAWKSAIGVMRTNIDPVEIGVITADLRLKPRMDAAQLRLSDLAARDGRLVADKHRSPFGLVQPSDRGSGKRKHLEILGAANESVFDIEGAVAIEEDGSLRLIERGATDRAGSQRVANAL